MSDTMKFSVGDLRAFANKIVRDLRSKGLVLDRGWAHTVADCNTGTDAQKRKHPD